MADVVELNKAILRKEEIKVQDLEKISRDKKAAEEAMARMKRDREKKLKEAKDNYEARVKQIAQSMDDADARVAKELEEVEQRKTNLLKHHEETCAELQAALEVIKQKRGIAAGKDFGFWSGTGDAAAKPKAQVERVVKSNKFDPDVLRSQYMQAGMTPAQIEALLAIQLAHLNSISEVQTVGGAAVTVPAQATGGVASAPTAVRQQTPAEVLQTEVDAKEHNLRVQLTGGQINQQQFEQLMMQLQNSKAARLTELNNQAT